MPIKPIDLQTLFMQLNKVSREQTAVKEGAVLQQSIQSALLVKKREDEVKSVQRPGADEGSDKIGDKEAEEAFSGGAEGKKSKEDQEASGEPEVMKDPDLGQHVDISG